MKLNKYMNDKTYPEVRECLEKLIDRGWSLIGYDDGDEYLVLTGDLDEIVEAVHSVLECAVEIEKDSKFADLFFVLGNEPGVALSDYSCSSLLSNDIDEVSEEIYNKYNN
jgi:hypothetical protein